MVLGGGAFGKYLGLDKITRVGSPWWDYKKRKSILSLIKRERPEFSLFLPCENTARKQPFWARTGTSPRTQLSGTMIMDFSDSSELWGSVCSLRLSWHFVIVSWANILVFSVFSFQERPLPSTHSETHGGGSSPLLFPSPNYSSRTST